MCLTGWFWTFLYDILQVSKYEDRRQNMIFAADSHFEMGMKVYDDEEEDSDVM